jgi:SpoVK/Ycf46/Vps4 family AAA+-type ATPase
VLQVAEDFRAWPHVAEAWRLDRFGSAGITALFAGPPGTGKTLAAEVIAGEIGLDLMVVDLSLLVSKWVGETEKNLDAVFTEAGASHCVLFFDEADTLFGRRGEVSRGADRYANLEVGYLLQRLDRYDGLVVLATNLRDQLDEAFTRRFQHLVHFPRPGPVERRRLWELVLGEPVVLDGPVDLDVLTELDLTGAGIAAVVRSAALAAHHDSRPALRMADLVRAVSRQFQREARLVPRDLLAAYAELLS